MPTAQLRTPPTFAQVTRFNQSHIPHFIKNSSKIFQQKGLLIKRAFAKHPYGRILVIIPNAVGSAPVRNRLRRQIKAIFFEQQLYTAGYDYAVWLFKEGAGFDFSTLQTILVQVCQPT